MNYDPQTLELLHLAINDVQGFSYQPEYQKVLLERLTFYIADRRARELLGMRPSEFTREAPGAPPAVVEAASKADKAGVSADAGYRTLAEWGRENGIRKGSDFWRAVVRERGSHG